jgi:polyisoprenoid-binding protein YceI
MALARHPAMDVMTVRRSTLIAGACVALAIVAVAVTLAASPFDPNHQTAEQVVSHAGVSTTGTPLPGQPDGG